MKLFVTGAAGFIGSNMTAMRANDEFYLMGRVAKQKLQE